MMRGIAKCLLAGMVCLLVTGYARPAAAQDAPAVEVSGGYQFLSGKGEDEDDWENFPAGWYFDVAGNVTSNLALVGQLSGNYKTIEEFDSDVDFRIHTFMGGVRAGSSGPVRAFGQFLVGGAKFNASDDFDNSASETDFAIQLGGGVTIMGASNVGLRLGLDYLRVFASDEGEFSGGEDVTGFRFVAGVVFGFGR